MSGSRSTATARTNPPLSGQESSGATQWAAMNHLQLNDLQIYREKAAGTSRAGVYLLDLTLWSGPQINPEDKERECVLIWECLEMFEPLNNLGLTLRLWSRPIKAIYNCPAMHSLACCPVPNYPYSCYFHSFWYNIIGEEPGHNHIAVFFTGDPVWSNIQILLTPKILST